MGTSSTSLTNNQFVKGYQFGTAKAPILPKVTGTPVFNPAAGSSINADLFNTSTKTSTPIVNPKVSPVLASVQKSTPSQTGATLSNIPKLTSSAASSKIVQNSGQPTGIALSDLQRSQQQYNASPIDFNGIAKVPSIPQSQPQKQVNPILPPVAKTQEPQTTDPRSNPQGTTDAQTKNSALADLQKQYLTLFNQTPQEQALQAQIDALNAQGDNVKASEQLGLNRIEDQPIAMNFIQGQQAALQRQAAAQAGALAAQQTPLTQRLAQAQAQRLALAQGINAQIGFQTEADKLNAPQYSTVSGNVIKINPSTGQAESIYSAPETADGFTLGDGQQRFDAQGNLIAGTTKDNSITPYQQAQLNLENAKLRQNNTSTSAEKLKLNALANSALSDIAYIQNAVTNSIGSGRLLDPTYKFHETNLTDAIGRLRSGGAISDSEAARFTSMLPSLLETDTTRNAKLKQLGDMFNNVLGQSQVSQVNINDPEVQDALKQGYSIEQIQAANQSFNKESQTSLNGSISSLASIPDNTSGGQCGHFVNQVTGLGVGDSYQSKISKMDPSIKTPEPGMVFTMPYKDTGHIGFILDINDGVATVKDSNFYTNNAPEQIKTHKIPVSKMTGFRQVNIS